MSEENKQDNQDLLPVAGDGTVLPNVEQVAEELNKPKDTPVQKQEVDETAKLKAELEELRRKAQEESHKRAILEARYQEVKSGYNFQPSKPEPTTDEIVKNKAKQMADKIIDNPDEAANILSDTLLSMQSKIQNDVLAMAQFNNFEASVINQIKSERPHLAADIDNIKFTAKNLLQSGQAVNVEDALRRAADLKHEVYENFYKSKTQTDSKPVSKPTGNGTQGYSRPNFNPSNDAKPQIDDEILPLDREYENRRSDRMNKAYGVKRI